MRSSSSAGSGRLRPWRVVEWDGATLGAWAAEMDGSDVVINLAGRSVNCRYTPRNRREILESRVLSTRVVGEAIAPARRPPRVWLQASTATIYAHRYDAPNDEASGVIGGDEPDAPEPWTFSIDVAQAWERALEEASTPDTRKVALRSAMTMSPDRGRHLRHALGLVRRGLGGTAGDGRQFVSWIHYEDFVRAVEWLIAHDEIEGAVNLAAPHPLPNAEFMRVLREASGRARRTAGARSGCWSAARSSCAPRRSWCSRAGASCRAVCCKAVRVQVPALGGGGPRPVAALAERSSTRDRPERSYWTSRCEAQHVDAGP